MSLLLAAVLVAFGLTNEIWIEAEDAEVVGAVVDTSREGYSGSGYVTGMVEPEDSLRFEFEAGQGLYEVRMGVASSANAIPYSLWINGRQSTGTFIRIGGAWTERTLGEHFFAGESHRVAFKANVDVDYLRLVPLSYDPPAPPPPQLSDPDATPSARALFGFLLDQYGKHILSGQQELRDVRYVMNTTGRMPAVAGGDLIEYSPSRWERGARPNWQTGYASVEDLIDWTREESSGEGIVTLMWHWNAPTDLIDSGDQLWWRGFYTEATTFDFAAALADTTSERYHLLLRDIDAIAIQLQKFQDADIPVLWRPLHEAEGTWFWWGARGPEPFKELWRLMYDRLVHHHAIHNLIWVFTHESTMSWYPGDAYVDVVGRDVYASDPAATMQSTWRNLQQEYGGNKLVALSESGTLPDPEASTAFGVWWSWFTIWSGVFIRNLDPEYLRRVYESERVLTRDELPNWRTYSLSSDEEVPDRTPDLAVYPNPTMGRVNVRATLRAPSDVRIEVFDALGRRVGTWAQAMVPAGVLQAVVDLSGVAAGLYIVRMDGADFSAVRKVVVIP